MGLKVVWLELPEERCADFSTTTYLAAVFSKLASVVVFNSESLADRQRFGFCKSRLFSLPPAPDDGYARQDDIFSELAVSDKPRVFFKKFSIGAVMDFSGRTSFELLLKAIKNCSNVIPNIQLVVIGPSAERRNLNWLAKKLGIEKNVWFVGEQADLVKWFNDLDLFFSLASRPSLYDLENALLAMSRGVPAAVFYQKAFQDFIVDGQTGLVVESMTVDDLARKLIDVEADKKLLAWIGANGQILTKERFNRKNQATMLARLFE
jgi:glycosyltransferase involved in cell wall biosynthesis